MQKANGQNIHGYSSDPEIVSISGRVAHFLDWAATKNPGEFYPPAVVLQAIMGYSRTPRSNSSDIQAVRNSMAYAQKHLLLTYSRGLVSEPTIGWRATFDSEDAVRNTVTSKARRLNGAKVQLQRALDIVNPKEIPATEEGKQLKAYYWNLKSATKMLFSSEFEQRLLPRHIDQGDT